MMNERIAALYDQSLVLHGNGDYVAGELDVEKFAELIVKECAKLAQNKSLSIVEKAKIYAEPDEVDTAIATAWQISVLEGEIKKHFGVE